MSDQTAMFIVQWLGITLVVVPWWLYRQMRGLPFDDGARGKYGPFVLWAFGVLWLLFAGVAYLIGGFRGVFLFLGAVAGMSLAWASFWTPFQNAMNSFRTRRALRQGTVPPAPLPAFHQRFTENFVMTLLSLPGRLLDGL